MKPNTYYTKSGRINIAYQIYGSGPIDIVYIPGWVSNIDLMWACPELVHFFQELGKIARIILFDKRGTGLSDRIIELSTLEERMDDIRAVMDAVGSKKAILFGHSEGGSVSALFSATYPNRTISLITFGVFAKRRYAKNYPWAPTDEERQKVYDMIENSWGGGDMQLESLAPSKANDKVFMDWLANYFRSGASPGAAMLLTKMNTDVDIINILGSIKVPTLLMQRTHDIDVKIEEGRFIAERIVGAKFVEFDGDDHLFWAGNTDEVLREMKSFILSTNPDQQYQTQLYTLVSAMVHPDAPFKNLKDTIDELLIGYRGKLINNDNDTFIFTFDGPSKAVRFSMKLTEYFSSINADISTAIHIREGSVTEATLISDKTYLFIDYMHQLVGQNQVLITQTVKYLLSGSEFSFKPLTRSPDFNITDETLYLVVDGLQLDDSIDISSPFISNDTLLERVLECVEMNLSDELYSVERLCRDVGISERQLQRKLKEVSNKTPNQLISSIRLHRAKELVINKKGTIAEIAFSVGFASPSYFSKCFKRQFGKSPSELMS
jgi:pimeloyl-ACP methyl ester carboxylesterase/AraC-like DNA-binding protein